MEISEKRQLEIKIANRLKACSFLPGTFDKMFVKKINTNPHYEMTEKGRLFMFRLLIKYRRQIPDYGHLHSEVHRLFNIPIGKK